MENKASGWAQLGEVYGAPEWTQSKHVYGAPASGAGRGEAGWAQSTHIYGAPPPKQAASERRRHRSVDPLIALHYQLSHARSRGDLDAIVVADASGVVVAGAGSWAACEEIAAYAPILARRGPEAQTTGLDISRIDALRREVVVTTLEVEDQEMLICVRGGEAPSASLAQAVFGVARILGAAA
jgi:hypothetical protein